MIFNYIIQLFNPSNSVRIFYFGLYIISNEYLAELVDAIGTDRCVHAVNG